MKEQENNEMHVYFITGRGDFCRGTVLVVANSVAAALELCNGLSECNDKHWGIDFNEWPTVIKIPTLLPPKNRPGVLASEFTGE